MPHQETEGILSPFLRNCRLKKVGKLITENSVVLDLACGAGYLREYLPKTCKYYGIDRQHPITVQRFDDFLCLDLATSKAMEKIQNWLPVYPDIITCIAFLEHLVDPKQFIEGCIRLFLKKGKIIGTTPHPCGRRIHEVFAKVGLCSQTGANEHELFLGKQQLIDLTEFAEGEANLHIYKRFLLGLNQLFVIDYMKI